MQQVFKLSQDKAAAIRNSTRILFLLIGCGLIIMGLAFPPIKTLWISLGNLLAAVLILFSIVGLSPSIKVSGFGKIINNTIFHVVASFLLGMGIIIAAMLQPPVNMGWYVFFNLVGFLLVFDAIITSSWNVSRAKVVVPTVAPTNAPTNDSSKPVQSNSH